MDRGCSSGRLDCLSMKAEGERNDIVFFSVRGKIVMSNDQGLQRHRGRAEAWMPKKTCADDGNFIENEHGDILLGGVLETTNSAVSLTFSASS